ncbi:MAG: OmpA family protein, partial [Gammaproteobacteria bacterium]|nr:OmpA family protein [Gammaproteobacteria bacterium]
GQRITLEGNTDERGSREYNIALSERRALSVQRILEFDGIASSQITVVGYGEEKPAAEGSSEAAWRLNRRVEIVYQGQ